MSTEQNKKSHQRFFEIWNAKTPEKLDTCVAANYVRNEPLPGVTPDLAGIKQWQAMVSASFPDIQFSVESQIAEGDMVSTRWSCRGTHKAEFMGIPATNKSIVVTGMIHGRFVDGKVAESWGNWDAMGMMQQMGVIPAPEGQAA